MTVTPPGGMAAKAHYRNHTTAFDGVDRQPHAAYVKDYTITLRIPGESTLDFYTIDGDHHQVAGDGVMKVPNVKTPQPYNGNFLELKALDVTPAP